MSDAVTALVYVEADGTPLRSAHALLLTDRLRRDYWSVVLTLGDCDDLLRASHARHVMLRGARGEVLIGVVRAERGPGRVVRLVGSGFLAALDVAA